MNMSVKLLKQTNQVKLSPLVIPEIQISETVSHGQITISGFSSITPANLVPEQNQVHQNQHFFPKTGSDENSIQSKIMPLAEEILNEARAEASQILVDAEAKVEQIQQEAREQGLAEANEVINQQVNAQVADLRQNLTVTIEEISKLYAEITSQSEHALVKLALEIAKKIVHREVTVDREIALALTRVTLQKLHQRAIATVHLNPDDLAYVEMHRDKLHFHGTLNLIEDPSISLGSCLIRTETGDVDARIEQQFDEITHGLLGG
jgi:flagellar assembly protein FliH